ncbi:MAG: NAD(P)(+) transhydrogenase (Re/Si-specific) subunit beta [Verrucomicrobia bacterium]|nr:NAD(P)(+) transhydrogenase (Re/Si-specific) subunit beta [Verrucomicrobiota bacterium]
MDLLINFAYIVASILFIFGIKMLGSADTARRGNQISSLGMLIAVVAVLLTSGMNYTWIIAGLAIGAVIGAVTAKRVQMTGMPELVALFNGFGGLASLLVGWAEYAARPEPSAETGAAVILAILIGGITFTGSLIAYLKLSGKMGGNATLFGGQKALNALIALAIVGLGFVFVTTHAPWALYALIALSLLLGVLAVIPIGGGDMPVVIAILNSFSGLAASAAGFVIQNNVLIVAGCLVGASGLILSIIMCKAMNRTLGNVLFGSFGAATGNTGQAVEGEMKAATAEDAYYVLEAAQSVVFVPGYGMAVAQAQHAVKELAQILESNGAEVRFAIHPVAGRMPGHMNVLLAEADVPYEQLAEMDDVNPIMSTVDVAIVIGANDVVNPAAVEDESSPIYGMPIIKVYEAKTVYALKRGQGAGFSGLVNTLFFRENTRMLYGDAKDTITTLVTQFKD